MSDTVVKPSSVRSDQDLPIVIAAMPISTRHRNIALAAVVALVIIDVVAIPFANVRLGKLDAFLPALQSVMCAVDLMTAALLLAQYSIHPVHGVLMVSGGYVFSGLFAFIQTLAFPGAYSATGLIGDGLNSAAWLFVFWHVMFSLTLVVYVLLKDTSDTAASPSAGSTGLAIASAIACVLVATAGLTWLAIDGTRYLPALYLNALQQTPFANNINIFLWTVNVAAFVLLLARRRTILDLWLIVILFAWWPNFFVAIVHTVVRFSAGWYMARFVALIASSTLLIVLLAESTLLYGRLANAFVLLRRERADRLIGTEAATAAMAHELRQPLTGIASRGAAGLNWLKRMPPEINRARECLEGVVDASHRADEIIASIRELFKRTPTQHTMIQINLVVREVLNLVREDLQVEAIATAAEYGENLPDIHAAHTQIQEVILNLVKNAIDAMRSVPPDKRRLRLVTGLRGNSGVSVYIQDSGPGIASDIRDRIFDPFFTTKRGGMGLGLSICRTIVEDHHGELHLSKTDSRGTSFEVMFPT
ncbi:MAG: ATP-binding protein [Xanthobacteraceae bacterium]